MTNIQDITRKEERDIQYEFIRVVAIFFVVAIHVLHKLERDTSQKVFAYYSLTLLFITCDGLFYFLSGKFALQAKCETKEEYIRYYLKKFQNLIIPIGFYMILRSAWDFTGNRFSVAFLKTCIDNIMMNYAGNEYWFLYVLLGAILIAPFLSKFFQTAEKFELGIFLLFGLFWNACSTYLPYWNRSLAWNYAFNGWLFFFFAGYCVERLVANNKKGKKLLILLGAVSFVVTIWMKYRGYTNHLHDLAPTYFFVTSALFVILRDIKLPSARLLNRAIFFIGRHSFSVYMLHMSIFNIVLKYVQPTGSYLGKLFLLTVLTIVISLFVGCILDNTIVFGLRRSVDFIYRLYEKNIFKVKTDI